MVFLSYGSLLPYNVIVLFITIAVDQQQLIYVASAWFFRWHVNFKYIATYIARL